jgi:hypothetical protein
MENLNDRFSNSTRFIRWTARILSVISIGLLLGFIIGEGIHPTTLNEKIGLIFFPFGIAMGMIIAWWREGLGGGITVGSLLVFYVIHFAFTRTFPNGPGWLLFTVPGFLFLLSWYKSRNSETAVS